MLDKYGLDRIEREESKTISRPPVTLTVRKILDHAIGFARNTPYRETMRVIQRGFRIESGHGLRFERQPLTAALFTAIQLPVNNDMDLATFRAQEQQKPTTYDWVDPNVGVVRIPIDRASELRLGQGLPLRGKDAPKTVKETKDVSK